MNELGGGRMIPDTLNERRREVGRIVWSIMHDEYAQNVGYPDEVNGGGCESFALDAQAALDEAGYNPRIIWHDEQPTHCFVWVTETGLVYDSEAPYGVPQESLLPFFLRGEHD